MGTNEDYKGRNLKLFTRVNTGVLEKVSVNNLGLSLSYIMCNMYIDILL